MRPVVLQYYLNMTNGKKSVFCLILLFSKDLCTCGLYAISDLMAGRKNHWGLLLEIPFQRYSTLQIVTEQNAVPRYTDLFTD